MRCERTPKSYLPNTTHVSRSLDVNRVSSKTCGCSLYSWVSLLRKKHDSHHQSFSEDSTINWTSFDWIWLFPRQNPKPSHKSLTIPMKKTTLLIAEGILKLYIWFWWKHASLWTNQTSFVGRFPCYCISTSSHTCVRCEFGFQDSYLPNILRSPHPNAPQNATNDGRGQTWCKHVWLDYVAGFVRKKSCIHWVGNSSWPVCFSRVLMLTTGFFWGRKWTLETEWGELFLFCSVGETAWDGITIRGLMWTDREENTCFFFF